MLPGTSNPRKVYETVKMARELLGQDAHIRFHSHETAGTGLAAYLAALDGGADGIDLAMKPVSGGTGQPDIISMWHALKGTEIRFRLRYCENYGNRRNIQRMYEGLSYFSNFISS